MLDIQKDIVSIREMYSKLSSRADILYHFVLRYSNYISKQQDYGMGKMFSMLEIHILTSIDDNPGITATELAKMWHKTRGAISQIVAKLVDSGLVRREKKENNSKTIYLYVTEQGLCLSDKHKAYDVADIVQTLHDLRTLCSDEEIDSFYKVLSAYASLLEDE